jgi:hypothetical protein
MRLFTTALRPATRSERPPPTVAPIDIGSDASCVARRVLSAARRCPEMCLCLCSVHDEWFWHGRLGESAWRGEVCRLMGLDALAEIDPTDVFAVSFIGDDTSSGVRLFDIDGGSIALWTTDVDGFDMWLDAVAPHHEWQVRPAAH